MPGIAVHRAASETQNPPSPPPPPSPGPQPAGARPAPPFGSPAPQHVVGCPRLADSRILPREAKPRCRADRKGRAALCCAGEMRPLLQSAIRFIGSVFDRLVRILPSSRPLRIGDPADFNGRLRRSSRPCRASVPRQAALLVYCLAPRAAEDQRPARSSSHSPAGAGCGRLRIVNTAPNPDVAE